MIDGSQVLDMILKFVAVVAMVAPAMWLLRRFTGGAVGPRQRLIHVLEARSLAGGQVLYLLRVGEQDLLVAGSKGGLFLLSTVEGLSTEEPTAEGLGARSAKAGSESGPTRWAEHLRSLWAARSGACAPPAGVERD